MRVYPRLLKDRVFVVLAALVGVHLAATAIIGSLAIQPSFASLDRAEAFKHLQRCVDGIEREISHVATMCADWATWDDTYRYAEDQNEDYTKSNLIPASLESNSRINALFIVASSGRVMAGSVCDSSLGGELHLPEFAETAWPPDHTLLQHATLDSEIRGVVMTQAGPVLVVSRPILTSRGAGPARGAFIAGRFLNEEVLAGLRSDLHLDFTIRDLQRGQLSAEEREVVAALPGLPGGALRSTCPDRQRGYALLKDVAGAPALLVAVNLPRDIVIEGRMALRYALATSLAAAVLLLAATWCLMQRLVLRRVSALQESVKAIDDSGDLALRVPVEGSDELTTLSTKLNRMLERIESTERALRRSQEMAEHANRLKSRFLSNVSHEIRTPMNGIMGFCDAILRAPSVDVARQHSRTILRESNLLLMLVNDLLDTARIESGRLVVERVSVDLVQLLQEVRQTLGMQAQAKRLDFSVTLGPDVPTHVWGDPLRLRQVLVNLGANAVKFTAQGEVRVNVERQEVDGCAVLLFSVRDTGIGIAPEQHGDIFDAFQQADPCTTRKYGGTGLGLAIVRQLVSLMCGRVRLESALGQGSTFSFWIPLEPAPAPDAVVPVGNDPATEQQGGRAARTARILLADDHPTNQEIARLFLEEAGHHVTVVSNGREAVDTLDQEPFDLAILDVQMPVMDGLEAVRCIRQGATHLPIIALTASAEFEMRTNCLLAGFQEVITKPIRREMLLNTVSRWLDEKTDPAYHDNAACSSTAAAGGVEGEPPIDLERAACEFGGSDVLGRVLTQFLAQAADQLAGFRAALAQGERDALHRAAHSLKGAAATIEAEPLAAAAAALDKASASADITELERCVDRISVEMDRLVEYVAAAEYSVRSVDCAKPGCG